MYARASWLISPFDECRTVFGAIMRCNTRDFVQRRVRFFGIFEHNLTYYTIAALREGDLYVDIGANVGYFTLLASHLVGKSGKVLSVEADPVTFEELLKNLELNRLPECVRTQRRRNGNRVPGRDRSHRVAQ